MKTSKEISDIAHKYLDMIEKELDNAKVEMPMVIGMMQNVHTTVMTTQFIYAKSGDISAGLKKFKGVD